MSPSQGACSEDTICQGKATSVFYNASISIDGTLRVMPSMLGGTAPDRGIFMDHARIRQAVALVLCLFAGAVTAAQYDIGWTGDDGYTMSGSFSFDDSLLNTDAITETDIDSLIIEVFLNGASQGSWSLVDDGFVTQDTTDSFNFNFDLTTEAFPDPGTFASSSSVGQLWNFAGQGADCGNTVGFSSGGNSQAVCVNNSLANVLSLFGINSTLTATRSDVVTEPEIFDVSGTVTGLQDGNTVALRLDAAFTPGLVISGVDNRQWFFRDIPDSSEFAISIFGDQPANQLCVVENGTGTINGADVNNVEVNCVTRSIVAAGAPGNATIDLVTTGGASVGCSLETAAVVAPPLGGPENFELPQGAVDFSASGCIDGAIDVEITFEADISGAIWFKFIDGAWRELPGVTITGNTAQFSITDNGPFDTDLTTGVIRDPSGPGFPADPGTGPGDVDSAEPIPAMGAYMLAMLAGLLAALGWRQLRRRH